MSSVTLAEAQARLPDLIAGLIPGSELVITENQKPVATLQSTPSPENRPVFGRCKDMLVSWVDDDEHLADFAEYMP